jgi:hypothetical protein
VCHVPMTECQNAKGKMIRENCTITHNERVYYPH